MATVTIQGGPYFKTGDVLNAYTSSSFGYGNDNGYPPPVAATATATVASDGTATFTGLADTTAYRIGTGIAPYIYIRLKTPTPSLVASVASLTRTSDLVKRMAETLPASLPVVTQNAAQQMTGANYVELLSYATVAAGTEPPVSNSGTPNPVFEYSGGPFDYSATFAGSKAHVRIPVNTDNTVTYAQTWRVAFDTDAPAFEIIGDNLTGGHWSTFRVWVDEQPNCLAKIVTGLASTNGSAVLTMDSTAGLVVGQEICSGYGANQGFPAGTSILSVDSAIQVTMTANATATTATQVIAFGFIVRIQPYIKVDLSAINPNRAMKRIVIEFDGLAGGNIIGLSGINFLKTDTVQPPKIKTSRLYVLSDSYGYGFHALNNARNMWNTCGRLLGINDVWNANSLSSTGVTVSAATKGAYTHANRIADIISAAPDILVITGSINDSGAAAGTITAGLVSIVQQVRAALPRCIIVLTEMFFPGTRSAGYIAVDAQIDAAYTQLSGDPYIALLKVGNATPAWFSGTGKQGAPANNGNADWLLYTDGTHPNPLGQDTSGAMLAQSLGRILQLSA